jgi:hypothetical protein
LETEDMMGDQSCMFIQSLSPIKGSNPAPVGGLP